MNMLRIGLAQAKQLKSQIVDFWRTVATSQFLDYEGSK